MSLDPRRVYAVRTSPTYDGSSSVKVPELPPDTLRTPALAAIRELLQSAGLDARNFGSSAWNPFGDFIREGDRVLLKPNWVLHENNSGAGLDCLVTHATVIEAVLEYAAKARPRSIVLGDAPMQGCNFPLLRQRAGLDDVLFRARRRNIPVELLDFRLVTRQGRSLGSPAKDTSRTLDQYVPFDLGAASYLEPISQGSPRFRVTMYDPAALESTHGNGRHRYLIARELIESDVVINLPKLKTHKKAGITGALKNIVGANGHKSYLPHHRKGGSADGGDCYSGRSYPKALGEELLDRANHCSSGATKFLYSAMAITAMRTEKAIAGSCDLEGSWYGNDTVWRMVLDLQRILHYGKADGTVASRQQHFVLNLTDAIIGGQGEGPLAPVPARLGVLTLGTNAAATEWVNAMLMGLDPARIPLTKAAFGVEEPRLADFQPGKIVVRFGNTDHSTEEVARLIGQRFRPAAGWVGHCERAQNEELVSC
jgi:uncharacterized protein (DUF362 family)